MGENIWQDLRYMESILTKAVELPRFNMLLIGVFAGVAFLLAVVGILD